MNAENYPLLSVVFSQSDKEKIVELVRTGKTLEAQRLILEKIENLQGFGEPQKIDKPFAREMNCEWIGF